MTHKNTFADLEKRARRLVKQESRIPTIDWEKEAHAVKTQARRDYACGFLTFEQMCRVVHIVTVEDDLG